MSEQQQQLILIRGLPGSGKSTLAEKLAESPTSIIPAFEHFEADMYFIEDSTYVFDAQRICQAHAWCRTKTREALLRGRSVIVSNTFTTNAEMYPYSDIATEIGVPISVIELYTQFESIHDVPSYAVKRMRHRWEKLDEETFTLNNANTNFS